MRTFAGMLALVLAQSVAGCGNNLPELPTAPTSTPVVAVPVPPPAPSPDRWNLTTTVLSVTGPGLCVANPTALIGFSRQWLMETRRSGESSIRLFIADVQDPGDYYEFVGTVVADEVAAALPPATGTTLCGGVPVPFSAEERVSGRFSADGATFTGEESDTYRLASGEVITYRYTWRAQRQSQ